MPSQAWLLGVRRGSEEEYKRRHDEMWPELKVISLVVILFQ